MPSKVCRKLFKVNENGDGKGEYLTTSIQEEGLVLRIKQYIGATSDEQVNSRNQKHRNTCCTITIVKEETL